jgi:polyphenol oxidase
VQSSSSEDITLYEFGCFQRHPSLLAGCTRRGGGVSRPPYDELNLALHVGDDPQAVLENRRRLAGAIDVDVDVELSAFVVCNQAHAGRVEVVSSADAGRGAFALEDAIPDTDAIVTADREVLLTVMQADCVPVILLDPLTPAIGVAHAGWRGTMEHVVRNTVETMRRELGSDPARIIAGIGPSIGPASYAVGADVAKRAQAEFPRVAAIKPRAPGDRGNRSSRPRSSAEDGLLLDLWSCTISDLLEAGVPRERIELAAIDTFASAHDFFSDRRQRPTGRFMALAMLR